MVLLLCINGEILCPPQGHDAIPREFCPSEARDMSLGVVRALAEICDQDEVALGVRLAGDAIVPIPKSARQRSKADVPAREQTDGWAMVKTATILDRWTLWRFTGTSMDSFRCSLPRPSPQ
eukprot:TRINITY_DN13149_c0_g1_i2.p3 TRINITY_DN13149_c0_g1~~TRINITY_DN13149_c0_g1_i2.p3  ORF type:complete len:121 (+),score=9.79 TRINITY_DN13149_c0_g1_i2:261-623(+)